WYKYGICRSAPQPRDSFKWHSEYGKIGHGKGTNHSADLNKSSERVNQPGARIGSNVVEYDPQAGTRGSEDFQDARDPPGKTTRGPTQSCVLNKNNCTAPPLSSEFKVTKSVWPPVKCPRDATDLELDVVGAEGVTEVPTVVLKGVRRFVFPAK